MLRATKVACAPSRSSNESQTDVRSIPQRHSAFPYVRKRRIANKPNPSISLSEETRQRVAQGFGGVVDEGDASVVVHSGRPYQGDDAGFLSADIEALPDHRKLLHPSMPILPSDSHRSNKIGRCDSIKQHV